MHPNFPSKPTNPWIKASKSSIPTGGSVTFTFGADNATKYTIGIDKDGTRKITETISSGKQYSFSEAGSYTAYVKCSGAGGNVDSSKVSFSVFDPIILGDDFVATITNSKGALNLCANSENNVFVKTKDDHDDQRWHFERQSDNSYKITNVDHEKCLDVADGNTASGTNIQIYNDNGTTSQRFFIRDAGYGYAFVPKINTDLALDIYGGNLKSGTNVQDYTWNGTNAQIFSIDYIGLKPAIVRDYNGHYYEFYDIQVPWNQAYRFCESKGGHMVTISDEEENFAVYELCGGSADVIWIVATDIASEGNWYWVTGEPFSYNRWAAGEPNNTNGIEHYGMMWIDAGTLGDTNTVGTIRKWNDGSVKFSASTTYEVGFVCEYDNDEVDANAYTPVATETIDGITFSVYDYCFDWQTAEAICEAKGGRLVKIDSAAKQNIVTQVISKGSKPEYWINATDRLSEGVWTDSEGNPLSYFNWVDGDPNNDFNAEQYVMISKSTGKWGDLKGFSPNYRNTGFICESEDTTEPEPSEDGWVYCSILPSYVTPDKYTIEYDNYYEKQQKDSPGADWVKAETIKNEWVNSCSTYNKSEELSTSDARVLVSTSYYHICGGSAPEGYANYEYDCTYVHYDSVPNSMIGSRKYLGNDNGHWYYALYDKSGDTIWCQSGVTCDGTYGTHGKRSSAWYATFTYQDRVKVEIYKYTKDSGWVDTADSTATSTKIRYKKINNYILGDVDGDEDVGATDVTYIQRYDGMFDVPLSEESMMNGDVDDSGDIEIVDATYIQRWLAEMTVAYPIGEPIG